MVNRLILIVVLLLSSNAFSQDIFGKWKTIDDQTGEAKSIVKIYKRDGKVFGKIVAIFDASKRDLPCVNCEGEDYNKPILGLNIIKNMEKEGDYYRKGTVVNPEDGRVYRLRLALEEDNLDVLQVRGYFAFFYQTQYWERVAE